MTYTLTVTPLPTLTLNAASTSIAVVQGASGTVGFTAVTGGSFNGIISYSLKRPAGGSHGEMVRQSGNAFGKRKHKQPDADAHGFFRRSSNFGNGGGFGCRRWSFRKQSHHAASAVRAGSSVDRVTADTLDAVAFHGNSDGDRHTLGRSRCGGRRKRIEPQHRLGIAQRHYGCMERTEYNVRRSRGQDAHPDGQPQRDLQRIYPEPECDTSVTDGQPLQDERESPGDRNDDSPGI